MRTRKTCSLVRHTLEPSSFSVKTNSSFKKDSNSASEMILSSEVAPGEKGGREGSGDILRTLKALKA